MAALSTRVIWLKGFTLLFVVARLLAAKVIGAVAEDRPLEVQPGRGLFDEPFAVTARAPHDAQMYFTTNGTPPNPETSAPWPGRLEIRTTTVLRLACFKDGSPLGAIATHTYIFPDQVRRQTGAGFPSAWGMTNGRPVAADYEMDPEIVEHPKYRDLVEPALRAAPTVSIVMRQEDLFDPARGIYANPMESGIPWERSASVEWLNPSENQVFQADCGIRIQGGWNRRPEESPKHSFRLVFHKRYGPAPLAYPVFGASGAAEFQTLILRAGCNNTWLHWSGDERRRGEYLRDQWMRDTVAAMGHPSARGRFVHVYLNGLYWGLYNLTERPSAPFVAAHLGGTADDYDARNGNHILEGNDKAWNKLFRLVNEPGFDDSRCAAIGELLDLPQFADFIIANLYGANGDWDRASNWYAARRRKPAGRFLFFVWDAERTLEGANDNILKSDDDESPMRLFQRLRQTGTFRHLLNERLRRHVAPGGALHPAVAAARFQALAAAIDLPMIGESARWGDYRRDFHAYKTPPYERYTRDDHWRPEVKRLVEEYFPRRTEAFLKQLREAGLIQE